MNASELVTLSTEQALALVRGELSSPRRWWYRLLLVAVSIWVTAIVSLWATEPGPLPTRLHIAFAAFTAIGGGWIAVLTWILTRRSCPTALDRIATSWMATIASGLFLAVGVPIAVMREGIPAALSLTFVGAGFLCGSLLLLRRAYFICRKLRAKLAELEV